jgi:hypothetical protein
MFSRFKVKLTGAADLPVLRWQLTANDTARGSAVIKLIIHPQIYCESVQADFVLAVF